ncbi:hypothetical protein P3X46_000781 [Hevea brasiliensis]|uniref:Mechanosensitive ion channel protein n=1 Tax=Hevea brasiliensis TaxID=3981 RepID=A0ABQ9NAH9_HEVBR|nr:hypothetical protein P3X46_000781 [Hevea brasiliensis]
MDYSSMKKSFKSHGSYKQARIIAEGGSSGQDSRNHEELPILSHQQSDDPQEISQPSTLVGGGANHPEVIVKVDASSANNDVNTIHKTLREPSFGYMNEKKEVEDQPSNIVDDEISLDMDMDMEMDELRRELRDENLPSFQESSLNSQPSKEIRVSFEPSLSINSSVESVRRRYKDLQDDKDGSFNSTHSQQQQQQRCDEVLKCTSNASFRTQTSRLSRLKTKSRLLDPSPGELGMMSGRVKSEQLKSGLLVKPGDDDEDDPLEYEDLPEEYKRVHLSPLTVLQWLSLIAIIALLACSLSISTWKERTFLELKLWKWVVLLLVFLFVRLVSCWCFRIIVFFIERNFLLRKRVLYFVYGLRNGVQNCWWLGLVLLAWHFLFDAKVRRETKGEILKYVTKILICFLAANFIWLLKTLMVKVLASSFHVSTYFDRIQESIYNQFVIETLSGPPLIEIQRNEEEQEKTAAEIRKLQNAGVTVPPELKATVFSPSKSGRIGFNGGQQKSLMRSKRVDKKVNNEITIDHLHKLNTKNISAWNMKRLMNIVRHGSLSTLEEQILDANNDDEYAVEIRSEYEAKAAARKIFNNVACRGSKYIYLEDLLRFMKEDEALKTMSLFEGASETSRINKSSLKNWVRRALALTLNDTKTAVNKLHQVVNVVVGVIILVIWLLILGIATSKFVMFMGSQIVVVSFIFGNTARTLFESIIFLFFVHPFDVGDLCEVDGRQLRVEEMNILTTIFLRDDNLKVIYHNNILATKAIGNFYRSPDMGDGVEFFIHVSTPAEKIALMKQRITSYIEGKKEHWYPNPMVILLELADLNKVKVAVWWLKFERRALLLDEMVKIFKELDIQYRLFPIDVNIHNMPPLTPYSPH